MSREFYAPERDLPVDIPSLDLIVGLE